MPPARWRTPLTDRLFEAVLALRTPEECERFFEDLCTMKEITDLSHRLEIARLLHGGAKYEEVIAAMRERLAGPPGDAVAHLPSTATISRINRFLRYGADGYRLILERVGASQRA
ncbi:MAG TPA: YerC/YecD family TrpR-related protein [Candidatus Dormibacteraeota bacterium]|jgi:TrpR-related protein YerC/YecD|nr:YerC/YecD family TrpR-related protein [Candidatus Dormibacteraeota bacterium]